MRPVAGAATIKAHAVAAGKERLVTAKQTAQLGFIGAVTQMGAEAPIRFFNLELLKEWFKQILGAQLGSLVIRVGDAKGKPSPAPASRRLFPH